MCKNSQINDQLFTRSQGRINLGAKLFFQGQDLVILLAGGDAHIGAVALAPCSNHESVLSILGHREGELTAKMASRLAHALDCHVVVCAGIHYPAITMEEIEFVYSLCDALVEDIIKFYKRS